MTKSLRNFNYFLRLGHKPNGLSLLEAKLDDPTLEESELVSLEAAIRNWHELQVHYAKPQSDIDERWDWTGTA